MTLGLARAEPGASILCATVCGAADTMTADAMGTPTPRAPRFDLRVPVRYRASGGDDWHAGSTENMSRTGLLFRADRLLPVSTPIEMLVTLPMRAGRV